MEEMVDQANQEQQEHQEKMAEISPQWLYSEMQSKRMYKEVSLQYLLVKSIIHQICKRTCVEYFEASTWDESTEIRYTYSYSGVGTESTVQLLKLTLKL